MTRKGITVFATEYAKKNYKKKKIKKTNCPSCKINIKKDGELKKDLKNEQEI